MAAHGITPAWAGKSSPRKQSEQTSWDHPRMGGEKQTITRIRDANEGSPPHGRGKVAELAQIFTIIRLTPAWAGKSGSV